MNDLQSKLDRLADGELSRAEYAELLGSLDHEEEGWKKCALTFLESQALRSDMRQVMSEPSPLVEPAPPATARSNDTPWHWMQVLAVAASLGLAFWLGRGSVLPGEGAGDGGGPHFAEKIPAPEPAPDLEPWRQGQMTVLVNGPDGTPRELEVPVLDGNYVDPSAILSRSTVIPPNVLDAIERSGHKIERHREFMRQPVDAEHEVVVPVERLRVVPVSNPMY